MSETHMMILPSLFSHVAFSLVNAHLQACLSTVASWPKNIRIHCLYIECVYHSTFMNYSNVLE